MADQTFQVNLSQTAWTNISGGNTIGLFTNNSEHSVRYRLSTTQPAGNDTFGHILHPQEERDFDLEYGTNVWALSFAHGCRVAVTPNFSNAKLVNSRISFEQGPALDTSGRLRVSEPFGVNENKNISGKNRVQWNEQLSGVILGYSTLVGGPFDVGAEIRGTGMLVPNGTITANNGSAITITGIHFDWVVGMTITQIGGVHAGATAVLTTINTGSSIQHNYDHAGVNLTVGTSSGDYAIRRYFLPAAYVPFKANYPTLTFKSPGKKAGVVQRIGVANYSDAIWLEITETDIAFVVLSSTSGTSVPTRYPQNEWNLDRLDGGISGGPNPSGITLDISKVQLVALPYTWQGVGPVFFGFDIGNKIIHAHQLKTANESNTAYIRNPSLHLHYEIRNVAATASSTTLEEICSTISSEGGYTLPGSEFSAPDNPVFIAVDSTAFKPVFAIRLKSQFPVGKPNARILRFLSVNVTATTNDCYVQVRHLHDPIDLVAAGWAEVSHDSGVEFTTNITSVIGRPSHLIVQAYAPSSQTNKASVTNVSAEFINVHSYCTQNYDSTNSHMFVVYAKAVTGNASVCPMFDGIEFD